MSYIIQQLETEQLRKNIPSFRAGDTVIVKVRVREGNRERLQAFEGVVITKRNRGLNSSFIVRKISNGEGVERTFQTHSPIIAEIIVKRRGDVRTAKMYRLRKLSGRAARIKEKIATNGGKKQGTPRETKTEPATEELAQATTQAKAKETETVAEAVTQTTSTDTETTNE